MEGKRRKEEKKWAEMREIRTKGQVWEVVGRERKRQKRVNEDISMEEWDGLFRSLLAQVEGRIVEWGGESERIEKRILTGRKLKWCWGVKK